MYMINKKDSLCFCGSGKYFANCHNYINENSYIADLYKLQNDIDLEIEKQEKDNKLKFKCKPGCCECCSQCYCVSETEFIQILDYIKRNWTKEEIEALINKADRQWDTIKEDYSEIAKILQNTVPLKELYQLNRMKMPFPCLFLNNNMCSIYQVRPLVCRIHGTGYANTVFMNIPCGKNNNIYEHLENFVNLVTFSKRINRFVLLNYYNAIIIRKPAPLFYDFYSFTQNRKLLDNLSEMELYRNLIELDKDHYMNILDKTI